LNTKKALVTGVAATAALVAVFVTTSREPESIKWIPYTTAAVAGNKLDGKSSAVLFYARWTLSADPKGGLATPAIHQSLVDAGFVTMEADLTNSSIEDFRELKEQGFTSIPVLVLYPTAGPRVSFNGGTPESEIVSAVVRPSR